MKTISPARLSAYETLTAILYTGKSFTTAFTLDHRHRTLSAADLGLAHAIVMGVLRNRLLLGEITRQYLGRGRASRRNHSSRMPMSSGSCANCHWPSRRR